ncbi:uncharacterized protein LOC116851313 [Odontomachus brunneus]|uniref:uncharacterized protein LOC116851313 n=1 Tax=Odontomachus brunneus TaxID=486640 RepID=UPI0013F1F2BA|nr:uncharacterized protein LOC116851313 [Odontomachus brunneus]
MLTTAFFYLLKPVLMTLLEDENFLNVTKSSISVASKLPFHVEYNEKLDQHIYLIMMHCYLAVFAHVFVTTAVDTLYYALIQHACGMFAIIGHMLENIGKDNDANFHFKPSKQRDDNYIKALSCLRRHLHVIEFAELIESTYTRMLLISVNLNMIAGSIPGIEVIMNIKNPRDVAAPLAIYIAQLIHLFLQFWQAQYLLDYSIIPYKSISRSNWYHTSQRCRKIFLLIMLRASSPCKITAGKIMTLSIESFSSVTYFLAGSISITDIFQCVPSITITVVFSFKIFSLMLNTKKIKACLKRVEEDWLSLQSDIEKTILQRRTEYGQRVTTFYAIFMATTVFFFLLKPVLMALLEDQNILNVTKSSISVASKLPFLVEYNEKLDQHVYLIMIHCYLAVFAHLFVTTAVDTLYYALIQHACGMFEIIGHTLESIGKNNDANFHYKPNKIKDDNYIQTLNCLRRHLHIIDFAELIESMYTQVLLVSVNLNMIAGSLPGIEVTMNLNSPKDIAAPLAIYIAQLIHLFLQFWQAQYLLDYSTIPYKSICRSNWYHTSQRCQKIFLLIMLRTSSPCKITAGKIITLSIESFSSVLKTSMSYLTLLRSLQ